MKIKRILLYLSLTAVLLLVVYRLALVYNAVKPATTTSVPAPVTLKETNTLTWTREVVVGAKK